MRTTTALATVMPREGGASSNHRPSLQRRLWNTGSPGQAGRWQR